MSKDPKYMNARVFVANLASDNISNQDLMNRFEKHGKVVGMLSFYFFFVCSYLSHGDIFDDIKMSAYDLVH
jgi:hypothetical protein